MKKNKATVGYKKTEVYSLAEAAKEYVNCLLLIENNKGVSIDYIKDKIEKANFYAGVIEMKAKRLLDVDLTIEESEL